MKALRFVLPVPPSKNAIPEGMPGVKVRRAAMRATWVAACSQHTATKSPPAFVRVSAHFYVGNTWDDGNLTTALYSIVFDALQLPPGGRPPSWRQGLSDLKGFIVDDSPRHLQLVTLPVPQTIERIKRRRRLELVIIPAEAA